MGAIAKKIQDAGSILLALGTIGFIGIVLLVLYGNLSGNLGFASNTVGANNTNLVINNITGGTVTFFGFSNTFFTFAAIVVLFAMFGILLKMVGGFGQTSGGRFSE